MLFDRVRGLSFCYSIKAKIKFANFEKKTTVNTSNMKTILFNEIIVYENNKIVTKLTAITEEISEI